MVDELMGGEGPRGEFGRSAAGKVRGLRAERDEAWSDDGAENNDVQGDFGKGGGLTARKEW